MDFLKRVEISFRRFLLRLIGFMVRRGAPLTTDIDFNSCKFLFVRQDRIGDVLVSTPLIYVLKKHYPNAAVDFLLSSNNYFVLDHEPLVRKRWIYAKNLSSALRIIRSIRRERYDFVVDLMDNPSTTSTVVCALAGGKWNVGLSKENEYVYDVQVPLLSRKETHIIDRLARLLTVFGIDIEGEDLSVRYVVSTESTVFARKFFESRLLNGKSVIGLNISPATGVRFWGTKNFQELIGRLKSAYPRFPLLILFQPADRAHAEEVASPFDDVFVSPETHSFDQFAALVAQVGLLVTPDTSAVHLAAAFHIPSVVLYVQSNKELRIWEPYASVSETLVTDVDDLTTIHCDRVYEAVTKLLNAMQPHSPANLIDLPRQHA